MTRAIVGILAILMLCLVAPAFAAGTVLNIGYQPSTHQIAEMVAFEKGWWQDELKSFGITEVKEFQFPTGAPEMQAMLAGDLDVAYTGTAPPLTAIAKGLDAKIVAGVNIQGSNLVLKPDLNYEGPKSLNGLSIATYPPGTIQDIILRKWLNDSGVDAKNLTIRPMNAGDAVTAIEAGKVDGIFVPHPYPSVVEGDGKGKSVVASGEMWPDHACCSILVSGKLLRENPDLVKQIIRIHINATEYVNEHPDEAAEIYAKKTGQDINQVKDSM